MNMILQGQEFLQVEKVFGLQKVEFVAQNFLGNNIN